MPNFCKIKWLTGSMLVASAIIFTGELTNQVQAKETWPCGPVNEYTCYPLPCKEGDSTSTDSNQGTTHCVGDKAINTKKPIGTVNTPKPIGTVNTPKPVGTVNVPK